MKKNNDSIEFVVLNYFIRVIKDDGKYMLFRRGVKNNGIMKYLIAKDTGYHNSESPFSSLSSSLEVVKKLETITNDMARNSGKGGIKNLDKYEHVTMTINHLLHFFLESAGLSMEKLCSLGEEIYNLSCHRLFGDELEEIEQRQKDEINNINDLGQLKAKLFQEYVNDINSGKISRSMKFEDYFKLHSPKNIEKLKNNDSSRMFEQGHALGRMPQDNEFVETLNTNASQWLRQ